MHDMIISPLPLPKPSTLPWRNTTVTFPTEETVYRFRPTGMGYFTMSVSFDPPEILPEPNDTLVFPEFYITPDPGEGEVWWKYFGIFTKKDERWREQKDTRAAEITAAEEKKQQLENEFRKRWADYITAYYGDSNYWEIVSVKQPMGMIKLTSDKGPIYYYTEMSPGKTYSNSNTIGTTLYSDDVLIIGLPSEFTLSRKTYTKKYKDNKVYMEIGRQQVRKQAALYPRVTYNLKMYDQT